MTRCRIGALLVGALVVLGASAPAGAVSGTSPGHAMPSLTWHSCEDGLECATLPVLLDHDDPGGPSIDLAVVRAPARDAARRLGSLVVNPGGPGASGVSYLRAAAGSFPAELRDRFDVVSFDPRGSGSSAPVDCVESLDPLFDEAFSPATAAEQAGLLRAVDALVAGCEERSGSLLARVSTDDTARDLERLRAALGERRLNFLGGSYGTFLGTVYASRFPNRVRTFVLDGAVDPSLNAVDSALAQAVGFERSLDEFLDDCAVELACEFHRSGRSAQAYDELRASLQTRPLAGRAGEPVLNATRFDAAVVMLLYSGRPGWAALAAGLDEADAGHPSALLDAADQFVGRRPGGRDDGTLEAFWAIGCLDGPRVPNVSAAWALQAVASARAPRLGAFVVNNSLACARWPEPAEFPSFPLTASGAPPILVIGTEHDPATPLAGARALAASLQRGVLLIAGGSQHTSFASGNRCVDDAIVRAFVSRVLPADGTVCARNDS